MTAVLDLDDTARVTLLHRRGGIRFLGAVVAMLIAAVVSESMSVRVVLTLGGALAAGAAMYILLVALGVATRRWALLLWPVVSCAALSVLDTASHTAAGLVVGIIVLSFLFMGLSQPPGRGLWFVPPAAAVYLQIQDLTFREAVVRLPIAALVWCIASEVPARLISELRANQRALKVMAGTDSLTGLLNRTTLVSELQKVGTVSAVALIDLDRFKEFNDSYGHIAGDEVLKDFAGVLLGSTRGRDRVFRYGGEEFLVIFAEATVDEAAEILQRFAGRWTANRSGLTFSAGVTRGGESAVRTADDLLYRAKREGRARVLAG